MNKQSWNLLIFKAVDPISNKTKYFFDKNLPFGSSISCSPFQRFSGAIKHILETKTGHESCCTIYLDNFLIVAGMVRDCNYLMASFLDICKQIGIPIAHEKTEWGTPVITFLRFLLDGKNFRLSIPAEKRIKAVNALQSLTNKRKNKATVKELQQLAGLLNFLCRAIFTGHAFTRRMYAQFSGPHMDKLRQYHHVKLSQEFISDCIVWLQFLDQSLMHGVS